MKKGSYKGTYRATAQALVAAAGQLPFFAINGASGKRVKVKRIAISGVTLTAVAYLSVVASKYSTAHTGGTSSAPTKVPLDSSYSAASATVAAYTAGPTAGTSVGEIASRRFLGQATTAAAAGIPPVTEIVFSSDDLPVLNSSDEGIALRFSANPATAPTMNVEIEWEEENTI